MGLIGFLTQHWRLILCLFAVGVVLSAIYFFGNWAYELGRRDERAEWSSAVAQVEDHSETIGREEGDSFRSDVSTLENNLDQGLGEIQQAALNDTRAFFLAYAASDSRLCNETCASGDQRT